MKEIVIGTQNQAKVKQIAGALASLGIQINGLPYKMDDVKEDGSTAQENARLKAIAYSSEIKSIVLSMDNALYLDGLKDKDQPGINVRRIPSSDKRPSDDEMLEYYISTIKKLGDRITGRWEFAVCIANNGNVLQEATIISPRIFVSEPSKNIVDGYPLESIQVDPESEMYISDMTQDEQDKFWQKVIGKQLCELVQSVL